MSITIYETPILNSILRRISLFILNLFGWQLEGEVPNIPKFVAIATHTSNWDFPIAILVAFAFKKKMSILAKKSLFKGPFGPFFKWMGCIPINRSQSSNVVDYLVKVFNEKREMILVLAPEGTRKKVEKWKSGFYHIAMGVKIPILLTFVDYLKKAAGIGPLIFPTGNYEADLKRILAFYSNITGKYPDQT
ncbi:MAG: lysophospholipid acyltransferase family protein [Deltaproteobacteria bacterium]|uniref:Lysophospholipid acyltransferase family protein n=1 Tax=Candidatus Zymogenus saltonus TaxID=2844893 RepID=A0A9D8KEC0_9DELT|nr:lysophospholipid acyltransferase family protein [Candidatus Zymogenus saltonus]